MKTTNLRQEKLAIHSFQKSDNLKVDTPVINFRLQTTWTTWQRMPQVNSISRFPKILKTKKKCFQKFLNTNCDNSIGSFNKNLELKHWLKLLKPNMGSFNPLLQKLKIKLIKNKQTKQQKPPYD